MRHGKQESHQEPVRSPGQYKENEVTRVKARSLTVFALAMMNVAAVVSLRGLPLMAREGLAMFFYILFATLLFLLPASLVAAELGGAFNRGTGGIYTWVKEAFGARWGFTAIWLQWVQNVIWYPTVLGFAGACLAYLFMDPALAARGWYTAVVIVVIYWFSTWMTLRGSTAAARLTRYGLFVGTIFPGLFIIVLGLLWINQGNPIAFLTEPGPAAGPTTHFHPTFFPHISGLGSIAFLAGILLLFAGVEVHAVRANELEKPARQYPAAMFLAMVTILLLFTLGSMAVATLVPAHEISLTAGLMQAFRLVLDRFALGWLTPVFGLALAFGAIGGVMSWIGGPSRGLLATAQEGELPPFLARTNRQGVQKNILIVQGCIVTALASLYVIMKDVSVAFFVLSAMTVTLYLVMYLLMYAAAIRLRYTHPEIPRGYRVPGGNGGMWFVAGTGLLAVSFAIVVGFFPPSQLPVGSPALYVGLVAGGLILFMGIPQLISSLKRPSWQPENAALDPDTPAARDHSRAGSVDV